MKHIPASFLLGLTLSATAVAADTGGAPGTAPAVSNGSSHGAGPTGFDVSGSHPLPNGSEQEPPGRGACGCRLTNADTALTRGAEHAALVAVLAVALAALRRRSVA